MTLQEINNKYQEIIDLKKQLPNAPGKKTIPILKMISELSQIF